MTELEAIDRLKSMYESNILFMVGRKREIEMAIAALEEQVGKRGVPYVAEENHFLIECAACHKDMGLYHTYCPHCGQKTDWEEIGL